MDVFPWDVKVSGSTLYSSGSGGVMSIDANPPFTVYGTYASECRGINDGNDSYVVRIDAATGSRSSVANLGCATPGGLAVAPDGSLLAALGPVDRTPARIIRIDPDDGSTTTVSTGGSLRNPADVALTASGDLVVADRTSGVLRISTRTGKQSTIASGGDLNGVDNVALDASGAVYAIAKGGPAAVLTASMPLSQRFSTSGILASVSCRPRCTVGYTAELKCCESGKGAVDRVSAKRALRLKMSARVNRAVRYNPPSAYPPPDLTFMSHWSLVFASEMTIAYCCPAFTHAGCANVIGADVALTYVGAVTWTLASTSPVARPSRVALIEIVSTFVGGSDHATTGSATGRACSTTRSSRP